MASKINIDSRKALQIINTNISGDRVGMDEACNLKLMGYILKQLKIQNVVYKEEGDEDYMSYSLSINDKLFGSGYFERDYEDDVKYWSTENAKNKEDQIYTEKPKDILQQLERFVDVFNSKYELNKTLNWVVLDGNDDSILQASSEVNEGENVILVDVNDSSIIKLVKITSLSDDIIEFKTIDDKIKIENGKVVQNQPKKHTVEVIELSKNKKDLSR